MSAGPRTGSTASREAEGAAAALRGFGSFTRRQGEMLALLDDAPAADSVGVEAEKLDRHQILVCERLAGRDLVRFDVGWRHSCWFRLTPAGRDALRHLRTLQRAKNVDGPTGVREPTRFTDGRRRIRTEPDDQG